ncbi:galanin peptides isoform X1 [Theropithecus gelada]|nr:galanin peptides isoform X1 [Theropithecus gelada]
MGPGPAAASAPPCSPPAPMPRGAAHSGFRPSCPVLPFQMARGSALLLASLLLAAALSASAGLWSPAKEKRGWTLNSAGYLLGPHAVGNHRSFSDKNGLTSKRELQPQDDVKPGSFDRSMPENNIMRTIIEFLSFLHLKEAGAFDRLPDLPAAASSEDIERS